jgi:predicted Zn-dependent protease
MNKRILCMGVMLVVAFSCQKEDENLAGTAISGSELSQISKLGFSTTNVQRLQEGYLVEGDIVLNKNDFARGINRKILRIAESEQYRTTNLVAAPRLIKVTVANNLPAIYVDATDAAIARYNAENLSVTFQRVRSGADIQIVKANFLEQNTFLASAGFPSDSGEPYNRIKVSNNQMVGQPLGTIVSVLAHEMGHCIGFRHTDFMDRSYSCGGAPVNEGASDVGAIQIDGTPAGPDAGSWMLSCIGSGQDRPFNGNDKIALDFLY